MKIRETKMNVKFNSEIRGDGWFKRDLGKFPPSMRKLLEKIGDEEVKSLSIHRVPLPELKSIEKFFKGGKSAFDDIWHLFLEINGKYFLSKDAVWSLKKTREDLKNPKLESISIPNTEIRFPLTINDWLTVTAKRVGKNRFFKYTSYENNCQKAVLDLINEVGVDNSKYKDFIYQDPSKIYDGLPKISKGLADLFNSFKEVKDRLIQGEGGST